MNCHVKRSAWTAIGVTRLVIHDVDCARAIALAERLRPRFGADRIAAGTVREVEIVDPKTGVVQRRTRASSKPKSLHPPVRKLLDDGAAQAEADAATRRDAVAAKVQRLEALAAAARQTEADTAQVATCRPTDACAWFGEARILGTIVQNARSTRMVGQSHPLHLNANAL
jgi:hypothetical protein